MSRSDSTKRSTLSLSTTVSGKTDTSVRSVYTLLPTAIVFIFKSLNPVLTQNGQCSPVDKILTEILLGLCGFFCVVTRFTDSCKGSGDSVHYGLATVNGLWPSPDSGSNNDLSRYKLRLGDFVHAFFSLFVFATFSLLDANTVKCFYPSFASTDKALLMALPPVISAVSIPVLMAFPTTRRGLG